MPLALVEVSVTLLLTLLVPPVPAQDVWPAGSLIEEAVSIQVTDEGLESFGEIIPGLIPEEAIEIDETGDWDEVWGCYYYGYNLSGAWVQLTVKDMDITPDYGVFKLHGVFEVQINSPWDRFDLWTALICIESTCHGYVNPFDVTFDGDIAMEVVEDADGNAMMDATVGDLIVDYQLSESDINLEDCAIGDVEDILNFFGLSLYTLILDALAPEVQKAVDDLGPELETTLEDIFNDLVIEEEIEVNDAIVDLLVQPHDMTITPDGLDLVMEGSSSARTVNECIAAWDVSGSLRTQSSVPSIQALPPATDIGILVSDDFANQTIYAMWRAGLLCISLGTADEELINTSILGLLAGEAFAGITEDGAPMTIATRPMQAPTMVLDGAHDLDVEVRELGLDFYAEIDDRMARALGLDLSVDAGIDLPFDGTTGELLVELALNAEDLQATVSANEISTASDEDLEATLGGAFQSLMETFLGPLIGDNLGFTLPSVEGLGLTDLEVDSAGAQQDWLAMLAGVGLVTYGADSEGCDESGEGCSTGCSAGTAPARTLWLLVIPLGLVGLRRRND